MNNRFSVCMSVYKNDNADDLITAVRSVVRQTCKPFEIILVQDGPVPQCISDAINSLAGEIPFLKLVRLAENVGHAGARKAAMDAASTELIAVMDSDDISIETRFERQLQIFDAHPEISVVGGLIHEFIGDVSNVVGERFVPQNDKDIKQYLKSRCPMNLVTVMYRKTDIENVGGFMDWYCEEDYYLWIRLALKGYQFYNIQENLVNVRVGNEMYRRRGGWRYFKSEALLQRYMLSNGVISLPRYIYNTLGRFAVQVAMPNNLRSFIFQKLFRDHTHDITT